MRGVAKKNLPSPRIVEFARCSNYQEVITKTKAIFFPEISCSLNRFGLANSHGVPYVRKPKATIPNSKFQIPNSKFQIPNSKFQIAILQLPYSTFHFYRMRACFITCFAADWRSLLAFRVASSFRFSPVPYSSITCTTIICVAMDRQGIPISAGSMQAVEQG